MPLDFSLWIQSGTREGSCEQVLAGAALSVAAWDAGLGLGSGLSVGLSPHSIGDGGGGTGDQETHQVPILVFFIRNVDNFYPIFRRAVYYFDYAFEDWVPKVLDPDRSLTEYRPVSTPYSVRILICIVPWIRID
jgi:hypothetical protein